MALNTLKVKRIQTARSNRHPQTTHLATIPL